MGPNSQGESFRQRMRQVSSTQDKFTDPSRKDFVEAGVDEKTTPTIPITDARQYVLPFAFDRQVTYTDASLDPAQFYEVSYIKILQPFAIGLIDKLGPVTFRYLSEIVARAHGFQRTGSQIKKQVWTAVSRSRRSSKSPNQETVFWPSNMSPASTVTFRGLTVGGDERAWQNIPHPELLGLAREVLKSCYGNDSDSVEAMADKLELARLTQATREKLEKLLAEAKKIGN